MKSYLKPEKVVLSPYDKKLMAVKKSQSKKLEKIKEQKLNPSLIKKVNGKSLSQLKDDLDKWFSLFIRLRNADSDGMVKCFTSDKIIHYKQAHAGHFISRRHMSTRWNEKNVQIQSKADNLYNQGNAPVFGKRLNERYGEGTTDLLIMQSSNTWKAGRFELAILINEYKAKVEKLKIDRNL